MKKIFLTLFYVIMLLVPKLSWAEESSRWVWAWSTDDVSCYVDRDTVKYDSQKDNVDYWYKKTYADGRSPLMGSATLMKSYYPNIIGGSLQEGILDLNVTPDSFLEKEANVALSLVGQKSIFKTTEHKWQWIFSSSTMTYSICEDAFIHYPEDSEILVYVKGVSASSSYKTNNLYSVDYEKRKVNKGAEPNRDFSPVPESLEEAIYNAAKNLANADSAKISAQNNSGEYKILSRQKLQF